MSKKLYLVVSDCPQSGKTTVSTFIASHKKCARMSSSDAILSRVSKLTGITAEEIKKRRLSDHNFCRIELISEGNKMADSGYPPGVACLDMLPAAGDVVIDGIRRAWELDETIRRAKKMGFEVVVIGVTRPTVKTRQDNTESELFDFIDYKIVNDKGLKELEKAVLEILEKTETLPKDLSDLRKK
ncbi:MAG: hypothetical protein Q7K21_05630 [Elusimicrobiota bacterium]|nr:hypothetical protein [Elusimicrobiota bacterium]